MILLSLGLACWPVNAPLRAASWGMTTYSLLVMLYLLFLGFRGEWVGPLLWPAVALHGVIALRLAARLRR